MDLLIQFDRPGPYAGPETGIFGHRLSEGFSGIDFHEAKKIGLLEANIHGREAQRTEVFENPPLGSLSSLLHPVKVDEHDPDGFGVNGMGRGVREKMADVVIPVVQAVSVKQPAH